MSDPDRHYTVVTREKATTEPEFGTLWSSSPYLIIERFMLQRSIPGDTRAYIDGDRVYRIHTSHIHLLPLDPLERRFIPTREGDFFFQETDPKDGVKPTREVWMPVGP